MKKDAVPCLNLVAEARRASANQTSITGDVRSVINRVPFREIQNTLPGIQHIDTSSIGYTRHLVTALDIDFKSHVINTSEILAEIPDGLPKNVNAHTQTELEANVVIESNFALEPSSSTKSSTASTSTSFREKR